MPPNSNYRQSDLPAPDDAPDGMYYTTINNRPVVVENGTVYEMTDEGRAELTRRHETGTNPYGWEYPKK